MKFKEILRTEHVHSYYNSIVRHEIYTVTIVYIVGCVYMFCFSFIEVIRGEDAYWVIIWRGLSILVMGFISIYFRTKRDIPYRKVHSLTISSNICIIFFQFAKDFTTGLLPFSLPNALVMYFYIYNAAFGFPLRQKVIQGVVLIITFILYAFFFSNANYFHKHQIANIIINGTVSILIGGLIERYKRLNFLQQGELITSQNKTKELNSVKGKLISILSHDLKSPINNLGILLQLREDSSITQEEYNNLSIQIRKSLNNLSLMLENLVQWSHLQMEGFKPLMKTILAKNIIDEVVNSLGEQAISKNIRIINDVQAISFEFDKEIVKLVSRNFLTNAIKFSHPGSEVRIYSTLKDNLFTISFKDEGTGISQDRINKLFTMRKGFSRGTKNETGSGLGLMITKDFIEMTGGSISVVSEIGKGSTFSVHLPLNGNEIRMSETEISIL